jgi:Arc/MetJ-type ribon-helix-helix transcriptional regulator
VVFITIHRFSHLERHKNTSLNSKHTLKVKERVYGNRSHAIEYALVQLIEREYQKGTTIKT